MGLMETQAALARLLTETDLRQRFFAEPEITGERLRLSAEETRQMLQITAPKASEMARSLQSKRRNEVGKMLPRTCEILDARLAPLFREYAANSAPHGVKKHTADALAFAEFLRQSDALKNDPIECRDLLRYEATWLRLNNGHFRVGVFAQEAIEGTRPEGKPEGCRSLLIGWFRFSPSAGWRIITLRVPRLCLRKENRVPAII